MNKVILTIVDAMHNSAVSSNGISADFLSIGFNVFHFFLVLSRFVLNKFFNVFPLLLSSENSHMHSTECFSQSFMCLIIPAETLSTLHFKLQIPLCCEIS